MTNLFAVVAEKIRNRADREKAFIEKEIERQRGRLPLMQLYADIAIRVRDGDLTVEQCQAALDIAMPGASFSLLGEREPDEEKFARLAQLFGIGR